MARCSTIATSLRPLVSPPKRDMSASLKTPSCRRCQIDPLYCMIYLFKQLVVVNIDEDNDRMHSEQFFDNFLVYRKSSRLRRRC